jgi:hypothetical protein
VVGLTVVASVEMLSVISPSLVGAPLLPLVALDSEPDPGLLWMVVSEPDSLPPGVLALLESSLTQPMTTTPPTRAEASSGKLFIYLLN